MINYVVITRFGGVGDMVMIEPTLEALYYKHSPCKVIFRTYKDYEFVFKDHPLVWKTVLDDNRYLLGCPSTKKLTKEEAQLFFNKSKIDVDPNPGSVFHYDFQGVIEKNSGTHGVDVFATEAKVSLLRKTPSLGVYQVPSLDHRVVVQLRQHTDEIRNLSKEDLPIEILQNAHFIDKLIDPKEYVSLIKNCSIFIGPDSSGVHLAYAYGVKNIVGIYNDRYPASVRSYPSVRWVRTQEKDVLRRYIGTNKLFPRIENPAEWVQNEAKQYCYGYGINLIPGAVPNQIRMMETIKNIDYVFSSYYLQGIQNWEEELLYWNEKISRGGIMYLHLPHPVRPALRSYFPHLHQQRHVFNPVHLVKWIMENTQLRVIEYSCYPDSIDSFKIIARKM